MGGFHSTKTSGLNFRQFHVAIGTAFSKKEDNLAVCTQILEKFFRSVSSTETQYDSLSIKYLAAITWNKISNTLRSLSTLSAFNKAIRQLIIISIIFIFYYVIRLFIVNSYITQFYFFIIQFFFLGLLVNICQRSNQPHQTRD